MKHPALALIASFALITPVFAQDPTPPAPEGGTEGRGERGERRGRAGRFGGMGGMMLERLTEELGLSAEQAEQARAFADEMSAKMREAFQSGDREGMRERMRALSDEMYGKLDAILTPEQREKAKALREQMETRRGQRGQRGGFGRGERGGFGRRARGERGGARLRAQALEALALGAEEAAVITPLLDAALQRREAAASEAEAQRRALLEKLAQAQGDDEAAVALLEAFRAERATARAATAQVQDQLREVLTVEQEAKLVALGVLE